MLKLSTIPIYLEIICLSLLMIGLSYVFSGFKFQISIIEIIMIVSIFAMSSPTNIIPISMEHIKQGRLGRNNFTNKMILSSVLDNNTPMPVMLITLSIVLGPALGLGDNVFVVLVTSIVLLVVSGGIGILIGFIISKILNSLGKRVGENKKVLTIYSLLFFVIFSVIMLGLGSIPAVASVLGLFGIFLAMFVGIGINTFEQNGLAPKIRMELTKMFAMFGAPIVFISVGTKIDLMVFKEIGVIVTLLVILLLSVVIKSVGTTLALKGSGHSKGDVKYAIACFIPKGITLVNFTIILGGIVGGEVMPDYLNFMIIFSAIAILITIPLGVTLMSFKGKEWLVTTEETDK